MSENILQTVGLTKKYRQQLAVDHVSMEIRKGDIYGFIGRNGAGKTTFMRMICGLARPNDGHLMLFGETGESNLQNSRKKIGSLIEQPALYQHMSVLQNLEIQQRYLGIHSKHARDELEELMELVGLDGVGHKKAGKLSQGMKQRLGLAIALMGEPAFLILDEPYNGLDPIGVAELRTLLNKLNREKQMTILFSSHILSEMEQLATRYGFIYKGRLIRELSAQELGKECEEKGMNLEEYFIHLNEKAREEKE